MFLLIEYPFFYFLIGSSFISFAMHITTIMLAIVIIYICFIIDYFGLKVDLEVKYLQSHILCHLLA
jgi:uncharacterized membrane protein